MGVGAREHLERVSDFMEGRNGRVSRECTNALRSDHCPTRLNDQWLTIIHNAPQYLHIPEDNNAKICRNKKCSLQM